MDNSPLENCYVEITKDIKSPLEKIMIQFWDAWDFVDIGWPNWIGH